MGAFSEWQPIYGAHGIPTFPVRILGNDKRPAVSGYLKVGSQSSRKLADKFSDLDTFGFALKRARITILDVDTPDERVLADALDRHGPTPVVVRTGGGKFHAYYRNTGEPRRIRPWVGKPIDLLGDGFTVAPPSRGTRGWYTLAQGTLDDLAALPAIRGLDDFPGASAERIGEGQRGDALFRHCMRVAHGCDDLGELLELATAYSESMLSPPMSLADVKRTAKSAWSYTEKGMNYCGSGRTVVVGHDTVDRYAASDPDALALLLLLRRRHWKPAGEFIIARAMAESLGWTLPRFLRARERLLGDGQIRCIRQGGRGVGDPPIFQWGEALSLRADPGSSDS
jgi:hypothetical protein